MAQTISATDADFVGWTLSPNFRGTSELLWGCLFTIFACTWTILHLNVPARRRGMISKAGRKVWCMLFAILAPELITAQAYVQWEEACEFIPMMKELGLENWTLTHSFFAEMGGFAVVFTDGTIQTVDCQILKSYIEAGCLSTDIVLEEAEIQDRSKSDAFAKSVAALQSIWFVSQCIARAAQHLALSHLELATCAYVICAIVTYVLWRQKPQDVDRQVVLGNPLQRQDIHSSWSHSGDSAGTWHPQALGVLGGTKTGGIMLYVIGVVFSGIHCIAWGFYFPTAREAYLWRVFALCSIGSAALILVLLIPYWGNRWLRSRQGKTELGKEQLLQIVIVLAMLLYFAGRLYLVFAMFYLLRSVPLDVYRTVDWTVYFPHWI